MRPSKVRITLLDGGLLRSFASAVAKRRRPYGRFVARHCLRRVQRRRRADFQDSEVVRVICCRWCQAVLTQRGMSVCLCLKHSVRLFSTDLPEAGAVEEMGATRKAPQCQCDICSTHCRRCGKEVGYHVTRACTLCLDRGVDNGHYWLFQLDQTTQAKRHDDRGAVLEWRHLSHNGSSETDPTVFASPVPDDLLCPICFQALFEPMRCKCGHVFCRGCIEHELDVRGKCPLDRSALAKRRDLQPEEQVAQRLSRLEVHCRFGLIRRYGVASTEAEAWEVDPDGCPATVPQLARRAHEATCPFRPHSSSSTAVPTPPTPTASGEPGSGFAGLTAEL